MKVSTIAAVVAAFATGSVALFAADQAAANGPGVIRGAVGPAPVGATSIWVEFSDGLQTPCVGVDLDKSYVNIGTSNSPHDVFHGLTNNSPAGSCTIDFRGLSIAPGASFGYEIYPTFTNQGGIMYANLVLISAGFDIPETPTWVMLMLGFSGIGFMMRRAHRKDAVVAN